MSNHHFFFFSWNALFWLFNMRVFLAFVCSHLTNTHTHWSWSAALYPKDTVKQTKYSNHLKELWLKNLTQCRRPCICDRVGRGGDLRSDHVCLTGVFLWMISPPFPPGVVWSGSYRRQLRENSCFWQNTRWGRRLPLGDWVRMCVCVGGVGGCRGGSWGCSFKNTI